MGSIHGSGRFPGEGNGNPLQYPCLENPMDRGTWQATIHGITKRSNTAERLTLQTSDLDSHSPGHWTLGIKTPHEAVTGLDVSQIIRHLQVSRWVSERSSRQDSVLKYAPPRACLMVQWLRLHAPSARGQVQFLARELDPTFCNWEFACHV